MTLRLGNDAGFFGFFDSGACRWDAGMLAAFDIGIGGGSLLFGPLVARFGYTAAFALAAVAAAVAGPYFLIASRK